MLKTIVDCFFLWQEREYLKSRVDSVGINQLQGTYVLGLPNELRVSLPVTGEIIKGSIFYDARGDGK